MFAETQGGVIEIISTSKTETVSTISSFT
jgi:hypothetical protein